MKKSFEIKKLSALLLVFILLFCCSVNAQQIISGVISDVQNVPVTYAILTLKNTEDSSIIKNEVTDSLGRYTLSADSFSGTMLVASAMGYTEQRKLITNLNQSYDFKLAEQGKRIDEVVVNGARPLIERKIDRTIFNVSQSITAIGGDALDAIKKAPGVNVSNDVIGITGKSNVSIVIDGKLLQLAGDDLINYLKSIPSDNINRIEVITTPPAQYDAAGNSGLVNIVMKKDKRDGMNGTLRAGYQQASQGLLISGGSLNYHKDKIAITGGINYNNGAIKPVINTTAHFPGQTFESENNRKQAINYLQCSVGMDYEVHKGGIIGIQYLGILGRPNLTEQNRTVVNGANTLPDSTLTTIADATRKYLSHSINLNYNWDIDTGGTKLSANINRMWYGADQNRHFISQNFTDQNIATGPGSDNKTIANQAVNITTAQLDITHPTKWIALTYGGKLSFITNNSANTLWALDHDEYQQDFSRSNEFNYDEKIQALYFSASKDVGKWSFQGGLRGEFTQTKGVSLSTNQTNTNKYFQLFPTVYILYKFNDDHVFTVNYSKRIQRPEYSSLDPFRWYLSPYSFTEGNPFLQPSFNHNFELSYTYKQRYAVSVYYQRSVHTFDQVSLLDTINNIQYFKTDNIGTTSGYGINVSATLNPTHWWESQLEVSGYYSSLSSMYYDGVKKQYGKPGFSVQNSNSFILNKSKTFFGELSFDYSSPNQSGYDQLKASGSINAGLKLLLLDKQLTLSLTANDLLATARYRTINTYNQIAVSNYFDRRSVRVMVNYKLGSSKLKEVRQRETGIEAEAGRAG
jgi:outer membrane receptor protein involved in Fe transport